LILLNIFMSKYTLTSRYRQALMLFLLLPAAALAQSDTGHHSHHHGFQDAEKWAKAFDDPKRDAWQKPHQVIQALKLKPDALVADIGAGTGYFAVRFAHMLPRGHVYAVDTELDMVKYLSERARREGLKNLAAVAATPGSANLPQPVDQVVLVDVYHHIDKREAYFRTLSKSLKPGARVAVIDFRMDSPMGPSPKMRIAPERVKQEMQSAGYKLAQEHTFLPNQYFLEFTAAAR
jgi:FkbM family methyltransferase